MHHLQCNFGDLVGFEVAALDGEDVGRAEGLEGGLDLGFGKVSGLLRLNAKVEEAALPCVLPLLCC